MSPVDPGQWSEASGHCQPPAHAASWSSQTPAQVTKLQVDTSLTKSEQPKLPSSPPKNSPWTCVCVTAESIKGSISCKNGDVVVHILFRSKSTLIILSHALFGLKEVLSGFWCKQQRSIRLCVFSSRTDAWCGAVNFLFSSPVSESLFQSVCFVSFLLGFTSIFSSSPLLWFSLVA